MLIHPWDGAISETEWRDWLAAGHDFGQLAVNGPDNGAPHVIAIHFGLRRSDPVRCVRGGHN